MDLTEREETTRYARKKINSYLHSHDYISALLLASIYVNIRLRSLLTNRLSPTKDKWEKTSRVLDSLLGFNKLVNLCDHMGLIVDCKPKKLKGLWTKRCNVAHESKLWRTLQPEDKTEIAQLCKSAIDFLQKTNS